MFIIILKSPDCDKENTLEHRRLSIVNLLRQKKQRSVRSRVEEQKKQERERQVRITSNYRSASRLVSFFLQQNKYLHRAFLIIFTTLPET